MAASLRALAAHSSTWIADLAILGPEDVAVDRTANLAYVSSQDRRAAEWLAWGMLRGRATDWNQRGCIYKLDLNSPLPVPFRMVDNLPAGVGFHPAGLDLHVSKDGRRRRLFVVNWSAPGEYAVELFDVEANTLTHVRTIRDKALSCPNAIAVIDENRFYVTNSLSFPPGLQKLETILSLSVRLGTGTVAYHGSKNTGLQRVATSVPYANGIAIDHIRKRLYVASTGAAEIVEFLWDPDKPADPLSRHSTMKLNFLPDNLTWEDQNTLWVAGSELLRGMKYTLLLRNRAPSRVACIRFPDADAAKARPLARLRPEIMYENDGEEIAACSVAAPYHAGGARRFIVGSCFADHAIICRAP